MPFLDGGYLRPGANYGRVGLRPDKEASRGLELGGVRIGAIQTPRHHLAEK